METLPTDLLLPLLQEETTPFLISAEQLKQWERCRKQFYYKSVLGLRWPSSPFNFELGRQVHQLLDTQAQRPLLPLETLLPATLEKSQVLFEQLAESSYGQAPIVATEWAFSVPAPLPKTRANRSVWLNGRIDRIIKKEGKLLIIDWKTGTAVPKQAETAWQTRLYLYATLEACKQLGYPQLKAEEITFCYVEASDRGLHAVNVPYTQAKHAATCLALQQHIEAMLSEASFPLPEACPDKYCPYLASCGIQTAA
jgi:hypothetical protein